MAIRTAHDLATEVANAGPREIGKAFYEDLFDSLRHVGGFLSCQDVTWDITTDWQVFDGFTFENSRGVVASTSTGLITIQSGSEGWHTIHANLAISHATASGTIDVAMAYNGGLYQPTHVQTSLDIIAGQTTVGSLTAAGTVSAADTIGIAMKASGAATIQIITGQLTAQRG